MTRFWAIGLCLALTIAGTGASAGPVGEMHRVTTDATASLRDADQRPDVRVTVWYPAAVGAVEQPLTIGRPGKPPVMVVGDVAPDAPFAPTEGRLPVILLSHGNGGTARVMGWFGIAMARDGYIVVAVDHPGNNSVDTMTVAGATLWWDRAEDLRAALHAMAADAIVGPRMDLARVGVAGMSAGGFTALVAAGARVDFDRIRRFCEASPEESNCRLQKELPISQQDRIDLFQRPEMRAERARAGDDHAIPEIRAAFAMAPGIVPALDPESLARVRTPVAIILGDADTVTTPATNGLAVARLIPGATLTVLPGVGHEDFLAPCTDFGRQYVDVCKVAVPRADTHRRALEVAKVFFDHELGRSGHPPG